MSDLVKLAEEIIATQKLVKSLKAELDYEKLRAKEREKEELELLEDSALCKDEMVFPFAHDDDDGCIERYGEHGPKTHRCNKLAGHKEESHTMVGKYYVLFDELKLLRKFYRDSKKVEP